MIVDEIKIRLESISEWLTDDLPTQGDVKMAKAELDDLKKLLHYISSPNDYQIVVTEDTKYNPHIK